MSEATTTQRCLFETGFGRPLVASFDEPSSSSDGGALLLRAADRRLGLTRKLSACLVDRRQQGKVRHGLLDVLRERVMALACGYPDTNDAARLAEDPTLKLLVGKDLREGGALASQPTLCRFEHSADRKGLVRLARAVAEAVISRHAKRRRRKARLVTIDFDVTHDETHGAQQLSMFNGFYRAHCYLPLLGFLRFDDEADQYLVCALLRAGNAAANDGLVAMLRRLLPLLRRAFPKARLRVRLDAGFSGPQLLDFLEEEGVEYAIGLAKNSVLADLTRHALDKARDRARRSGETEKSHGVCRYGARSWSRLRRIVYKAEVTAYPGRPLRDNLRFVVTNIETADPERLWKQIYCARGDVENRIKELKDGMAIDRTSSSKFLANQLRVLLTASAYALIQEIRLKAKRTAFARAQVHSIREHLFKLGARVVVSVRRTVFHFPEHCPHQEAWLRIAHALGARPG